MTTVAVAGFVSAQAFGGTARLADTTTGDPAGTAPVTAVPKPDPPPLPAPRPSSRVHQPAKPKPSVQRARVTPRPALVAPAPPPAAPRVVVHPAAPPALPPAAPGPEPARHPRPQSKKPRHQAEPPAPHVPVHFGLPFLAPASGAATFVEETSRSRTFQLFGAAMLAAAALLGTAALLPRKRLPVTLVRAIGEHRLELAVCSVVIDAAFIVVFIFVVGG